MENSMEGLKNDTDVESKAKRKWERKDKKIGETVQDLQC